MRVAKILQIVGNCNRLVWELFKKCYKFASAYLQGRVRIPIGGIVREPEGGRGVTFPGVWKESRPAAGHEPLELRHRQ